MRTTNKPKHIQPLRMWLVLIMLLGLQWLAASQLQAQANKTVFTTSGVVKDDEGEPLVGVTVIEKGKQTGAFTDVQGKFSLPVSAAEATLQFSYIGYMTMEKKATAGSPLTVVMLTDSKEIDEVVVIGYGLVKKSDLTGSVASVKSEVMEERLITSLEDGLKGMVAGVTVVTSDGSPGANIDIRIRGTNSINASNAPLYVVDGVLLESADANIAPGEIESMEILKDASATAIYGSRGANGVIIITTKQGVKGKAMVTFSTNVSYQRPVRLYEMMDAIEYTKYALYGYGPVSFMPSNASSRNMVDNEGYYYSFPFGSSRYQSHQDALQGLTPNTDWQRAMFRQALVQDYRLNISGGDDLTTYSIMGNLIDQQGIIIASDFRKYSARFNFDRKVKDNLNVGLNVSGALSDQNAVNNNVIVQMLAQQPIKKLSEAEWEEVAGETVGINNNPVYQANRIRNLNQRLNFVAKGYMDVRFAKLFRLNISGSYAINNLTQEHYYPSDVSAGGGKTAKGKAQTNFNNTSNWLNENILYIVPKLKGVHQIDGMLGVTFQGNTNYKLNSEVQNFPYEKLETDNMGLGLVPILTTNGTTNYTMVSFLARTNYKIMERYIFTASMRADGSSRLGEGHKWGYFPSGAAAWRVSEEPFIKSLGVFSILKLRTSLGVSGNTGISPYQTLALLNPSNYPMDGNNPTLGFTASRTPNPDLRWETTTQWDAGIDLGFFKNRLVAHADYFYKRTRDLLLQEAMPEYLGYSTRWNNRGKVDNQGVEFTLEAVPVRTKIFAWNSSFNIASIRSKVVYINARGYEVVNIDARGATNFGILQQGKPIGQWYGYKSNGVYKSQSEVAASGIHTMFETPIRPGYPIIEDLDGNGKIDVADRQIIGQAPHKFVGGFNNTFSAYGVELRVVLEYKYGGTVFNATRMAIENSKGPSNQSKRAAEYGFYPTLFDATTGLLFAQGTEDRAFIRVPVGPTETPLLEATSLYIEDASYLRVNDITLAYNLPSKWAKKILMNNMKVFVSCNNVFVFTKYSGYDPDVSNATGSNSDLVPNVDNAAYPRSRAYSAGFSLSF